VIAGSVLSPRAAAFERIKALVLDTLPSPESKRVYRQALDDFFRWFEAADVSEFTKAAVNAYRASLEARKLSPSTINQRLSAIRKLAMEAAGNGLMPPTVAAAISRVSAPNAITNKGKRDRALLAVLVGCGLRRREAAALTVDHIQLRDARWVIVDLVGKGGRVRSVPMPSWTKSAIDSWTDTAGIRDGLIFRAIKKGGRITGSGITPRGIFQMVQRFGAVIGVPQLAPHDLRRTFAKLAHRGRSGLEQIQLSLGHASITTTERYLGVRQDLTDAPCDYLGLTVEVP